MRVKLVFLDFDGVLNSQAFFREDRSRYMSTNLDRAAVARVSRIVERTGAKVVVSSTWRIGNGVAELRALLAKHGFAGDVIDVTPVVVHTEPDGSKRVARWREIDAWLAANMGKWSTFVILDDEPDMGPHAGRHVRTELEDGLLDVHVERAVDLLLDS
jgi:hypothetical protein